MKKILIGVLLLCSSISFSQKQDSVKADKWKTIYRASATKINDLVNTKLEVSFDYSKSWMYGKAWITLHPHFYPTDSLRLDAKSMNINEVSVFKSGIRIPLKYRYDSLSLFITLDKTYRGGENYTVFIDYTAKPNEIKEKEALRYPAGKACTLLTLSAKIKRNPHKFGHKGKQNRTQDGCQQ